MASFNIIQKEQKIKQKDTELRKMISSLVKKEFRKYN